MDNKEHWEKVFSTKKENEVSWFQPYPRTSVELIKATDLPLTANIIDIGGGDSHLVDALLDEGFKNVWVLDISGNAIERAKNRLGEKADKVHWVVSDILDFNPPVQFDCWHDRAAFHFLTTEENIDRYVSIAANSIKKNGYLILGTFSEQGPTKCSGLEIKQYSENLMTAKFAHSFEKISCLLQDHRTPFDTVQNFLFCSFKKK